MSEISPILIPICGILLPVVLVPIILGLKQARLDRECEHAERMKALEMGRTLPQDELWWTPAQIAVSIGAGVPVGVFLFAFLASAAVGFQEEIWLSAMSVGVTAVICGSILAMKHVSQRVQVSHNAKPLVDADAFDVVGSRG